MLFFFSLKFFCLSIPVTSSHPSFLPVPNFSSHSSFPLLSQPHPHLYPASPPDAPPPLPVPSSCLSSHLLFSVPIPFFPSFHPLLSQLSLLLSQFVYLFLSAPSPSSLCSHLFSPSLSSYRSQCPPSFPLKIATLPLSVPAPFSSTSHSNVSQ